jgi:hypothetical protein
MQVALLIYETYKMRVPAKIRFARIFAGTDEGFNRRFRRVSRSANRFPTAGLLSPIPRFWTLAS